ncbi:MAG: glucans biosynthesis glucosyltransferase MdoH, partial [Verrucomicrobiae bacterium]|nr:glucans biosynthesis glucosyltransferase MdoH [Verrucomicrobiae bacterium]
MLFVHLSIGVMSATTGFFILLKGPPVVTPPSGPAALGSKPRIALIMPIYHEEPWRVFEGMKRMIDSLNRSGRADEFDSYVLSDSQDPNAWVEEEKHWLATRRDLGVAGRIFYRRRKQPIHQKSGNVADFCRRWGKHYRYMIVLDADSIMTADS